MRLTGVLLAAGQSRRFGADKRLVTLPGGEPLAMHCARTLCAALDDVLVVLRPDDAALAERLAALGCRVTHNPHAAEGMGASIRHGVGQSLHSDGWLILPADLPLLRSTTVRQVAAALQEAAIPQEGGAVVPVCQGRRGHPVGFSAHYREGLLGLGGDEGARRLLEADPGKVRWLAVDDPGICRDADTPAALRDAAHGQDQGAGPGGPAAD
jgi:molybdenum cofactor cytidylyltransferase